MNGRNIIKISEWLYNKILTESRANRIYIRGEYTEDNKLDCTTLYVENVTAETEKAIKVDIDAETMRGNVTTWKTWIPKSAIINVVDCN